METKLIMLYRDWNVRFSSAKLQGIQVFICKRAPGEDILMQRISVEQKETRY